MKVRTLIRQKQLEMQIAINRAKNGRLVCKKSQRWSAEDWSVRWEQRGAWRSQPGLITFCDHTLVPINDVLHKYLENLSNFPKHDCTRISYQITSRNVPRPKPTPHLPFPLPGPPPHLVPQTYASNPPLPCPAPPPLDLPAH